MEPTRRPQPAGTCISALTYDHDRRIASRLGATETMDHPVFRELPAPTLSAYQSLLPPLLLRRKFFVFCFCFFVCFFFWVEWGLRGEIE